MDRSPGHHSLALSVPDIAFVGIIAKSGWIPTTLMGEIVYPSPWGLQAAPTSLSRAGARHFSQLLGSLSPKSTLLQLAQDFHQHSVVFKLQR